MLLIRWPHPTQINTKRSQTTTGSHSTGNRLNPYRVIIANASCKCLFSEIAGANKTGSPIVAEGSGSANKSFSDTKHWYALSLNNGRCLSLKSSINANAYSAVSKLFNTGISFVMKSFTNIILLIP